MESETQTFRSPREKRFYNKLRSRATKWAEEKKIPPTQLKWLLAAPDLFVLLSRLALDKRVSTQAKAKIVMGLAYFVSPVDLIPDFIVPVGFLDDVLVAAWIIYRLTAEINALDPSILVEHWEGDEDVLQLVREICFKGEEVLGRGLRTVASVVRRRVVPKSDAMGRGRG